MSRRDDAHAALGHLQHVVGELGAERMGALQRRVDGVAAVGRVVIADRAARLHRDRGDAVDDEVAAHHVGGAGEGGFGRSGVAVAMDEADIVRTVVPHQRRARRGRVRCRDDGGQRLVVDLDQLGGIDRRKIGFGHHEGDVVAHPAHPVGHQRRIARPVHRAAVAAFHAAGHRQVAPARGDPVGAGEHREHAGRGARLVGVDRANPRMGVGRAQHIAERHARQHDVVDIAAAAAHEARILEPRHRLTDPEFLQ